MRWVRRTGMHLKPYACVACGSSATPVDGVMEEAYFREGLDVNWGDSVFLCKSCVWVLGQLAGFLDPEQVDDLARKHRDLEEELAEITEERNKLRGQVRRILDGSKAMKEVKATRSKPTKKVSA